MTAAESPKDTSAVGREEVKLEMMQVAKLVVRKRSELDLPVPEAPLALLQGVLRRQPQPYAAWQKLRRLSDPPATALPFAACRYSLANFLYPDSGRNISENPLAARFPACDTRKGADDPIA